MRTLFLGLGLGLAFLTPTVDAAACSCWPVAFETQVREADLLFVGRVLRRIGGGPRIQYEVRVIASIAGCVPEDRVIVVDTGHQDSSCRIFLQPGNRYVIEGGRRGDEVRTGGCALVQDVASLTPGQIDFLKTRPERCDGTWTCADGSAPLSCLVDPCSTSTCGVVGATCEPNFCGGCTAEWWSPSMDTFVVGEEPVCTPW